MVEFPFYNIMHASLFKSFPIFSLEKWGRLLTIFISLLTSIFLFFTREKTLFIKNWFTNRLFLFIFTL